MSMHLEQKSREALSILRREEILTPEEGIGANQLNLYRLLTAQMAAQYPAPGWTGCVAMTLLKRGACLELTQRFALEYFARFKAADVSLIFSADNTALRDNHCFCLVGEVVANDGLFIGRETGPTTVAPEQFFLPLKDFLSQQKHESIVVDPLLNFVEPSHNPCRKLCDYAERHNITHIIGVRHYSSAFVANAEVVKTNAQLVANRIQDIKDTTGFVQLSAH